MHSISLMMIVVQATVMLTILSTTYLANGFIMPVGTRLTTTTTTTRKTQQLYAEQQQQINTSFMWNAGLNFGKGQFKFYKSFDEWMKVFPEEDRLAYPEIFNLPKGVYEISLKKPLGIIFEEMDNGKGVYVKELVPGGNADKLGGTTTIQSNDILLGITAVKVVGAKYERRLIPAQNFDFDTMVGAIQSNDERYSCTDVIIMIQRPSEIDDITTINNFISFFEPPFDNPWKQRQ